MRLVSLILIAACTDTTVAPTDTDDTGDETTDSKKTKDTACVDRTYERAAATSEGSSLPCQKGDDVLGRVTDLSGAPIAGALVNFCQGICLTAISGTDGEFCVEEADSGWYALEVTPPLCSDGYATALIPVFYDDGEAREFSMTMPDLSTAQALPATAAELEAAPGIFVTVGEGQLTANFRDPAVEIAGARLGDDKWPPIDLPGTVVDVWYLDPFEYEADPAMPVRFANTRKLADGTTLLVYNGSYEAQRWLEAGSVTAKGAWLEGDAALTVTSTVVLIEAKGTRR